MTERVVGENAKERERLVEVPADEPMKTTPEPHAMSVAVLPR
jgi:hypothetical protein